MKASEATPIVGTELQFGPLDRPVRLTRPRLRGFDYRGEYAYHVVNVVQQRTPVFEDTELGRWCLSVLEAVAAESGFEVLAYCLMPDHLHLVAQGMGDTSNLVRFMQRFKRRTSFHYKQQTGVTLWQSSYFDRILRDEEELAAAVTYVFSNPVEANLVTDAGLYPLSGGALHAAALADRTKVPSLHLDSVPSSSAVSEGVAEP